MYLIVRLSQILHVLLCLSIFNMKLLKRARSVRTGQNDIQCIT